MAKLLSEACDRIYLLSPIVRNELVVRKKLSSAAAAARRCLLEHMLEKRGEERLGIEGYPPERSVYESVLRASGIHFFDEETRKWDFRSVYESVLRASGIHFFDEETRKWDFQPPPKDNSCELRPCWDLIEEVIFAKEIQRIELVELFNRLSSVPYGLPAGVHPILFTAFYLHYQDELFLYREGTFIPEVQSALPAGVHPILFTAFYLHYQDELFLYREGTFIPEVQSAHLELLQRRPDLFSVSGAKLDGTRKAVVERLAKGLKQVPKTASVVRA